MNSFSKVVALAVLAAGTTLLSPASSAQAQNQRITPSGAYDPHQQPAETCCTAQMKPLVTNATWTVQPPAGPSHAAVPTYGTTGAWHAPFAGSQWIGPDVNAGMASEPYGKYTYSYHFCLCSLPPHVKPFPAAFYLSIYADNNYQVSLNNHTLPAWTNANTGSGTFTTPFNVTSTSGPATWFQAGDNVLQITVTNLGGPTGVDAAGWLSGYFRELKPGERCNRGGPIPD